MHDSFDASLALTAILRFPNEKLCLKTIQKIQKHLAFGKSDLEKSSFYRYLRKDDFEKPKSAFVICSFWVAQALARLGNKAEAKNVLENALSAANNLGLFSEHYNPNTKMQLGNFPQAYSHVGLINAAFMVSPQWHEIL